MSDLISEERRETESAATTARAFEGSRMTLGTLIVPAVFVVGLLFLLLRVRDSAETAVSHLVDLLPVGYAFGAGMVASVNPCGFFLLPSYLSYQLGTEDAGFGQSSLVRRVFQAFGLGSIATIGFVLVFGTVGVLIAVSGRWLTQTFPYAGLAIGGAMVALGMWLLISHETLGIAAASRLAIRPRRNLRNVFFFGIAYAIGSLSCTLPIFLVVVGSSLASQDLLASLGQFISYALGMGSILIAVTIASALFRDALVRWLRGAIPYVHRASALFLIGAGVYLLYYWLFYSRSLF